MTATTDPMQQAVRDALIGFVAASAEAQAQATKEGQRAGIAHAKITDGAYLGRKPSFDQRQVDMTVALKNQGCTDASIFRQLRLSRQVVYRILDDPIRRAEIAQKWQRS